MTLIQPLVNIFARHWLNIQKQVIHQRKKNEQEKKNRDVD